MKSNVYYRISYTESYYDENNQVLDERTKYFTDRGYFRELKEALRYLQQEEEKHIKDEFETKVILGYAFALDSLLALEIKYPDHKGNGYYIARYILHQFEFSDDSDGSYYLEDEHPLLFFLLFYRRNQNDF